MGGANKMSNYAGATARENSMRKNIPFTQQMKLRPKTSIYVQKYIDRIIELYKMGVFVKINADPSYITDVSKTFYELSNHRIKIDLSKLYET
jgi:glutamate mutase epsilon subunit